MANPVDPALIGLAEQALQAMEGMANAVAERTRTRVGPGRDVFVQGADNSMGDPAYDPGRAAERLAEIIETRREELAI